MEPQMFLTTLNNLITHKKAEYPKHHFCNIDGIYAIQKHCHTEKKYIFVFYFTFNNDLSKQK